MPTSASLISRDSWGPRCSETSSSNFPPPLVPRLLGCLLPSAYALWPPGPGGLSCPEPRELSTRAPPARLPGARPPARGSGAQSIKAWAARQQEAAAGLHPHSDPDSHWNPAKLLSRAPCGQGRSPGTTASHPEGHLRRGVWRGSGKWSRY